ncbi:MFS transporter [Curtobacterium flaccumfaciens]|uniref:MFS transporter n=1 Tax=Curtobacterium flaccumfaciens TaxID=2035 RepID=UPI0022091F3A|nr:MFS transporter [Curtobacterium flaccumfaciens]UWD79243.1 MFS transporter [Curtobacterium flaccumfaciens]
MTTTETRQKPHGLALATLCAAQFLVALDFSVMYVALPTIGSDLNLSDAAAQWVVSAYAVFFAGLLLVGGRLTDRLGARNVFVASFLLFGLASLVGGFAPNGEVLLGARAAQGAAAALLQPSVLGLLSATFDGENRKRAVSVWGAVGASGLALGVILGGVLTALDWRWTFLINLPFVAAGIAGALVAFRSVDAHRSQERIPVTGAVLGTASLLTAVFALTIVAEPTPNLVLGGAAFVAFVVAGVLFLRHERGPTPLIERALRQVRSIRLGAAATALYMASVGSEFYLVTLLLQQAHGYSPLQAGFGFLPLAVMVTIGNIVAGRLISRLPVERVLLVGFIIGAGGLLLLAITGRADYAYGVLPGLLISGFGHGIIYTSMFALGTAEVPAGLEGGAGALLTTSQYLSSSVTVAVLTIVLTVVEGDAAFTVAFLVTAACAVAGLGVAWAASRAKVGVVS